jgi:hypothetical protein
MLTAWLSDRSINPQDLGFPTADLYAHFFARFVVMRCISHFATMIRLYAYCSYDVEKISKRRFSSRWAWGVFVQALNNAMNLVGMPYSATFVKSTRVFIRSFLNCLLFPNLLIESVSKSVQEDSRKCLSKNRGKCNHRCNQAGFFFGNYTMTTFFLKHFLCFNICSTGLWMIWWWRFRFLLEILQRIHLYLLSYCFDSFCNFFGDVVQVDFQRARNWDWLILKFVEMLARTLVFFFLCQKKIAMQICRWQGQMSYYVWSKESSRTIDAIKWFWSTSWFFGFFSFLFQSTPFLSALQHRFTFLLFLHFLVYFSSY